MSNLLRSVLVLFAFSGAALPALAYPEHTIYVDTSNFGGTDTGPYEGTNWDQADLAAK